ncbi:hypothetical protein SI65_03810 [Aspergillus cristatus]|uniref:Uncharacterized protein n=1 Tax=Aspergillus cristatus TaxID=573508 RepID=A0A1E3BIL7_ASPCR|nr:hypothetical protein SI65_03810 [Aspergillus cristatus]
MSNTEENQSTGTDMTSLIAKVRNQTSQIASMKQTIEAQYRQLKENASNLHLQPYRDQAIADREALLNDTLAKMGEEDGNSLFRRKPRPPPESSVEADISRLKRLQDRDRIWSEREMIRLLNFYADLECRPAWRTERPVREETIEKWLEWVKFGAREEKDPFEDWAYQYLKKKMGW